MAFSGAMNVTISIEAVKQENDDSSTDETVPEPLVIINEHNEENVNVDGNKMENPNSDPKPDLKRTYSDHIINQKKKIKYTTLSYHKRKKRSEPKLFRDFTCTCLKKCHERVTKEQRQEEFENYVTLGSYEAQLLYIVNCVKESVKSGRKCSVKVNKTGKHKPREFNRKYMICGIEVCRDMFINTFQISPKKVDVNLRKYRSGNSIQDERGLTRGRGTKRMEDIDFVKSVIESVPRSEELSDQNGVHEYLKPGMTLQKVYNLYIQKFIECYSEDKTPVAFSTLKNIFYTHFNLRIKTVRKDNAKRRKNKSKENKVIPEASFEERDILGV